MRSKLGTINTRGPFEAQVAPGQNQHVKGATWDDAWGSRVKIRIPAIHTPTEPKDQDLPWAVVVKPTTSGGLNSQSCGLWGGEWVIAQYIGDQLYIIGSLDKNTSEFDIRGPVNGSTSFQRVDRYNSGLKPAPTQIIGGSEKPTTPVQPTKEEIQEAVKDPEPDPNNPNADVPPSVRFSGNAQYAIIGEDGKTKYQRSLEKLGETPERAAEIAAEQRRVVLGQ